MKFGVEKLIFNRLFNKNKTYKSERTLFVLGTIVKLEAYGRMADDVIDEAVERLNEIDDRVSVFKDYSEVSRINKYASIKPQKVSSDTFLLLKKAVGYSKLTGGTYDPTIFPLVDLWSIGTKDEHIPDEEKIKEKLKLVNYKDIALNENENSVMLKQHNQSIDLGGIAKGYAADEVRSIFLKYHIKSALIDLGGNILVLGKKADGKAWNVGIQDPLSTRGGYVGIISDINRSFVTSGNYERYFIKDEKKYHHIINPVSGYPSDSNLLSITIISRNSIDGDGLSTGIYILGLERGMELIETLDGIEAVFITADKEIYATSGITDKFKVTSNVYKYIRNYR